MEDNKNYIGTNIKNILKAREIEVKDFASKLDLTVEQVEKWFSCDDEIPIRLLPSILGILDVSYERLFNKHKKYSCIDESYLTYEDFKNYIDDNISDDIHIYRGQSNDLWPLTTSFCRYCKKNRLELDLIIFKCEYCIVNKIIKPEVLNDIKTECSVLDSSNKIQNMKNVSLFAYLQHNGVPTPLLDWSYSPYVALYFAIKDASPSDQIVLYDFNLTKYEKDYPKVFDKYGNSIIGARPITILDYPSENINQLNQQGLFMFCRNYFNVEEYFEKIYNEDNEKKYLSKKLFTLSDLQKKKTMESFKRMNITERSLFPDSLHVAKDIVNNIFKKHFKELLSACKQLIENRKA